MVTDFNNNSREELFVTQMWAFAFGNVHSLKTKFVRNIVHFQAPKTNSGFLQCSANQENNI